MTNLKKWQIIKSELVFHNRWCQVRQDAVKLSSGQVIDDYFVNIRPEIVLVVPVTGDNQLVFVRQYRHGRKREETIACYLMAESIVLFTVSSICIFT